MQKINFTDPANDLCESCAKAFKGGCPIWPTLEITTKCVEYVKICPEDGPPG
jgi:hypothetical protein